jgi:four helix bundle protein
MRRCFTSFARDFDISHFDILKDEQKKRPDFDRQQALKERLLRFASSVMDFAGAFARTPEAKPLVSQLVRSATSIGANYAEANAGESKADFVHKCSIARKEAAETRYWLKLAAFRGLGEQSSTVALLEECGQLVRIFGAIVSRSKRDDS